MWIDEQIIRNCEQKCVLKVWNPQNIIVVIGRSNTSVEYLPQKAIEVLRRKGGGGSVVLYPGCIIVSLGLWVKNYYQNDYYFKQINQALINSLSDFDSVFRALDQKGISDIAYNEYKVAGTSLFRSRNYLLYQASLVVDLNIELMELLLAHPSKEPEYRKQRTHREFMCDLRSLSVTLNHQKLQQHLSSNLKEQIMMQLTNDLIVANSYQAQHLIKPFLSP